MNRRLDWLTIITFVITVIAIALVIVVLLADVLSVSAQEGIGEACISYPNEVGTVVECTGPNYWYRYVIVATPTPDTPIPLTPNVVPIVLFVPLPQDYNWCSDPLKWGDGRCDYPDSPTLTACQWQWGWYLPRVENGEFTLDDIVPPC